MHTKTLPIIGYRKNGCPIRAIMGAAPVLDKLRDERKKCLDYVDRVLAEVEKANRDLSDTEQETLNHQRERIEQLDPQIKQLVDFDQLRQTANTTVRTYSSTASRDDEHDDQGDQGEQRDASGTERGLGFKAEQRKYEYKTRGEVVVDLICQRTGTYDSRTVTDAAKRAAAERLMGAGVLWDGAPEKYKTRAVSNEITSDVPGLLPKPIVGAVDNDLDAARPFVSSIGPRDLGSIPGKTFSRPVVTAHTTSGKQTAEKSELPSAKFTVGGVDFTKETHGGTLDVSRQTIDWTSPAAWDALLNDLQDEYGIDTETTAAQAFATAVTQTVAAPATEDLKGWATAIYAAAAQSYAGVKRMPDHIWVSLDMWAQMGAIVDTARLALKNGDNTSLGSSSPSNFAGNIFDVPRTVVPSFPDGTAIIGVKSKTEFYEQRIGLLTAVEPRLLGVEIAYGGYIAYGTLKPTAFSKVAAPPAG